MRIFFIALLASIGAGSWASAQSPLVVTAQVSGGTILVPLNGTLSMPSNGGPSSATVLVTNQGTASVTINQIAVTGTDFALVNSPGLPQVLNPGGTASFAITYRPTSGSSSGQVAINYTQGTQAASFPFALAGSAPLLSFSAVLPDNSSVTLAPGGVINFPAAAVQASTTAALVISNTGGAPASVIATVTGSDFQLPSQFSNLVSPGQQIRIPITFTPQAAGTRTGLLTVQWGTSSAAFTLQGVGAVPNLVVAYGLTSNKNVLPLADGGFLTFQPTPAKTTAEADVIISNQGTVAGSVKGVSLNGANFQLANLPLLPATLSAGQSIQFAVLFSPQQLGSSTGTLRVDLQDRSITVTVQGTTSAPGFTLLYSDPISKNVTTVPDAGTITLANIPVNATVVSTITLQNQGTGTGFVNAITVSGAGFQLTNLPPLPATVNAGGTTQFGLQFAPTQPQNYSGTLRIDYSDKTVIYTLAGLATGATFSYAVVTDQATTPVLAGGVLSFSTPVGQTTSQTLRVTNNGNGDGQIAGASISGAGFQITDGPPLPVTLKTGTSQTFTVSFTPTQAGTVNGRLQIGSDSFQLAGTALGSKLTYTYTNTAGSMTVPEGGSVILTPAQVGSSSSVQFTIQNSGTSTATISTVSVSGASFTLQNPPTLPANIDPGNSMMFSIGFAPNNTGDQTGSLRVNNATFSLTGNGQQPLAVPAYQFSGPSGTQQPLQQPSVSLHLVSPYSLPLTGTLALTFVSDVFSSNPAVQFATGGTTAHFTIPANSTDAVFDNGSTAVAFQTGTVAGTIKITPTFATQSGLDLTPASPPSLAVTINRSAPQLLSASMINRALKSFSVVITGFSTTRSLKTLTFTLSTSDSRFTGTTITTNVEPAATTWFQSTQSAALGGLFSATVPFTLTGGGSTEDLVQAIQAISVTATNDVGTSSATTVQLQ